MIVDDYFCLCTRPSHLYLYVIGLLRVSNQCPTITTRAQNYSVTKQLRFSWVLSWSLSCSWSAPLSSAWLKLISCTLITACFVKTRYSKSPYQLTSYCVSRCISHILPILKVCYAGARLYSVAFSISQVVWTWVRCVGIDRHIPEAQLYINIAGKDSHSSRFIIHQNINSSTQFAQYLLPQSLFFFPYIKSWQVMRPVF